MANKRDTYTYKSIMDDLNELDILIDDTTGDTNVLPYCKLIKRRISEAQDKVKSLLTHTIRPKAECVGTD